MGAECGTTDWHWHPERHAYRIARAALRLACLSRSMIGRERVRQLLRMIRIQERAAIKEEDYCYGG